MTLLTLENGESWKDRVQAAVDAWFGAGAYPGLDNDGDRRSLINQIAAELELPSIMDRESLVSVRRKINAVIDALNEGAGRSPEALGAKLIAWWIADRPELITLNGSQVTSWRDAISGYELAQAASGRQPLYDPAGFGGAPGVLFDGVDDCLGLEGVPSAFPTGAAGSEIWALVGQDRLGADASYAVAFGYGNASSERRSLDRASVSGQSQLRAQSSGTALGPSDVFDGRHLARAEFLPGQLAASLDNGPKVNLAKVHATSTHRVRMGATPYSSASSFWKGAVREIILVAPLTSTEADSLSTYLLGRRAL